jgi:DnaJ family protein C protein 9
MPESSSPIDLYALLELTEGKNSTVAQIKKAFHRLALKHHPDKQPEQTTESTAYFLQLSKAYQILSNAQTRAYYDLTGKIEGEECENTCNWNAFFQPECRVTASAIEDLKREYCNSAEEESDLLGFYCEFKGNVTKILECLMFSDAACLPRYREIVSKAVEAGQVKERYERFFDWKETAKAAKKREREQKQVEAEMQKLTQVIALRASKRNGAFLEHLEAKYSKIDGKSESKRAKSKAK